MKTDEDILVDISLLNINNDEKMRNVLQYHHENISWKNLKTQLNKIGNNNIVQRIENETLITTGKYKHLIHKNKSYFFSLSCFK